MGAIADRTKIILPTTWDALVQRLGATELQKEINTVKLFVTGQNVAENDEDDYDLRVQSYLADVVALRLIPTGLDYWNSAKTSVSTAGGPAVEVATFQDRIEALKEIQEDLVVRIANNRGLIEELLDVPQILPSYGVPSVSDGGDIEEGFVTPLPTKHFRDYAFPGRRTDRYGWRSRYW